MASKPWSSDDLHLSTETSCAICKKSFGVRKRHRRRTCRRCEKKVCDNCSAQKRFDFNTKQLVRICDSCLKNEHIIKISHRINNLKLKSKRNKGIYVVKTSETSREYNDGFVTNCKIIEINSNNVESFTAQQIANKLNIIKLPFKMTLDYTDADIDMSHLKILLQKQSTSFDTERASILLQNAESKSLPGASPKISFDANYAAFGEFSPNFDDIQYEDDDFAYDRNKISDREQIEYNGNNPYRQFCVVFNNREFKLALEFRNGFNLFHSKKEKTMSWSYPLNVSQHLIWGWYVISIETNKNIPVGSKLISINGISVSNQYNQNQINKMLTRCPLPLILIFEAPCHLKTVPRSTCIQYEYKTCPATDAQLQQNNTNLLIWWLEDGGFVLILLIFLAFILLQWPVLYIWNKLYYIILILLLIPSVRSFLFHWLFIKQSTFKMSKLFAAKNKHIKSVPFTIVEEHEMFTRKHQAHRQQKPKQHHTVITDKQTEKVEEKHEEKQEEKQIETDSNQSNTGLTSIDADWETNLCHPNGGKEVWGSYGEGSSTLLKVRGGTYLNDKIKVHSKNALFNIGHVEVFELHSTVHCLAQNECSWFYQNRYKLPKNLFFFIFHLRLDSLNCSIVIYWYIDKEKYQSNKISAMVKEKGDGFWCVGSDNYDESGLFWNFVNGDCQFRNDRLKMIARKEEGSWYLHIPSTPAIIAKRIPTFYYRAYDKKVLNAVATCNTKSESHEPYEFTTLCQDNEQKTEKEENHNKLPCDCGRCFWIDTEGKYPEYMELYFNPEAVSPIAKNTIKIASGVTKSLSWELHFLLEGQRNNIELPETVFANARISYIKLDHMLQID